MGIETAKTKNPRPRAKATRIVPRGTFETIDRIGGIGTPTHRAESNHRLIELPENTGARRIKKRRLPRETARFSHLNSKEADSRSTGSRRWNGRNLGDLSGGLHEIEHFARQDLLLNLR